MKYELTMAEIRLKLSNKLYVIAKQNGTDILTLSKDKRYAPIFKQLKEAAGIGRCLDRDKLKQDGYNQ